VARLKKKAKAERSEHDGLDEALHGIETWGDALIHWVSGHAREVILGISAILLITGSIGVVRAVKVAKQQQAAAALGQVESAYAAEVRANAQDTVRAATGDAPSMVELRRTYAERLEAVAKAHAGMSAAVVAMFQAGLLQEQDNDFVSSVATWEALLGELPRKSPFRPFIQLRLATAYEQLERWEDAARTYEVVSAVPDNPNRDQIGADAIRCFLKAGLGSDAQRLYETLGGEQALSKVPTYLRAEIEGSLNNTSAG